MVKYVEFIRPVFDALKELGGKAHRKEVIQHIIKKQRVSENDHYPAPSNSDLSKSIGFALTCLKTNEYVANPSQDFWSLTDKGRAANEIDPDELKRNYERIRSSRPPHQPKRSEARSVGPVRILTKEELFQPVVDALLALDRSGDRRAIAKQVIISEQLIDTSLLEDNFLTNAERTRQLYSNVSSAQTALRKARIISYDKNRWFLNSNITPGYKVDLHYIRHIEERSKTSRKLVTDFPLRLERCLNQRRANPSPNSYTSSLFSAGLTRIAQKVGEEALEVIIAALRETRERQLSEIADLLFHTLVLLVDLNIPLEEVLAELQRRHDEKTN